MGACLSKGDDSSFSEMGAKGSKGGKGEPPAPESTIRDIGGWKAPPPGGGDGTKLTVTYGGTTHIGWGQGTRKGKKENQDRFAVAQGDEPLWCGRQQEAAEATATAAQEAAPAAVDASAPSWFACYDGHGEAGLGAAQIVEDRLHVIYNAKVQGGASSEEAMVQACADIQAEMESKKDVDNGVHYSGSTAVFAALTPADMSLTFGQVGDSRGILLLPKASMTESKGAMVETCYPVLDHAADNETEAVRTRAAGGTVQSKTREGKPSGPARVWGDELCIEPGLMVTRSLGDRRAHEIGVISTPEVARFPITSKSSYGPYTEKGHNFAGLTSGQRMAVVMGSDGIWDAMDIHEEKAKTGLDGNERARRIVLHCSTAQKAADALQADALMGWGQVGRADNIAAVVVFIDIQ